MMTLFMEGNEPSKPTGAPCEEVIGLLNLFEATDAVRKTGDESLVSVEELWSTLRHAGGFSSMNGPFKVTSTDVILRGDAGDIRVSAGF